MKCLNLAFSSPPELLRILLDENLDWRLERYLAGHVVQSVPRIGWAGIQNGELIARAIGRFDVLVTMDVGFGHRVATPGISIVVLRAKSNRLADTRPLIPKVLSLLKTLKPGTVTTI